MIERLPEQVSEGISAGLYHLAFYVALTMPDIAGAIDDGNNSSNGQRYKKWFDTYASPKFQRGFDNFSSDVCWKLRNSVLHEGKTEHRLIVAESDELFLSSGIFGREGASLVIDIKQFCENMVWAFYKWIDAKEQDASFEFQVLEINDVTKGKWQFQ